MYTTIHLFGRTFSSYWTVFAVGCLVMALINCLRRKKMSFSCPQAIIHTLLMILFSLLGAKILYALENWKTFVENGITLNGVSFFGSCFCLPLGVYLICKKKKISFEAYLDYCTPSLIVMLAILRFACWCNGCCGGITYSTGAYTTAVVPTQIIECIGDLVILLVILIVEWHYSGKGVSYPYFLVLYGILRFFLEFVRDTPKDWLYLSHGQWFSLVSVAAGGYFLYRIMKEILKEGREKKKKRLASQSHKKRK